jgi:hypothetical protein
VYQYTADDLDFIPVNNDRYLSDTSTSAAGVQLEPAAHRGPIDTDRRGESRLGLEPARGAVWSAWLAEGERPSPPPRSPSPAGLTKDSESNTTTTVTVWLSGGTVDTDYTVTCRITTTQGRTDDRSIRIMVRNR